MTKKRFYLTLLILAVIVLALPGFTVKAARRLTEPAHPAQRSRLTPTDPAEQRPCQSRGAVAFLRGSSRFRAGADRPIGG